MEIVNENFHEKYEVKFHGKINRIYMYFIYKDRGEVIIWKLIIWQVFIKKLRVLPI